MNNCINYFNNNVVSLRNNVNYAKELTIPVLTRCGMLAQLNTPKTTGKHSAD
jgi:hypothetical protein